MVAVTGIRSINLFHLITWAHVDSIGRWVLKSELRYKLGSTRVALIYRIRAVRRILTQIMGHAHYCWPLKEAEAFQIVHELKCWSPRNNINTACSPCLHATGYGKSHRFSSLPGHETRFGLYGESILENHQVLIWFCLWLPWSLAIW